MDVDICKKLVYFMVMFMKICGFAYAIYILCCFRRNVKLRPQAAIIPNFHLPMRSFEVKNR